jgi:hypothetical protein
MIVARASITMKATKHPNDLLAFLDAVKMQKINFSITQYQDWVDGSLEQTCSPVFLIDKAQTWFFQA